MSATEHNDNALQAMFAIIDTRRSEAFHSTDRDLIFKAIESSVGFDTLNGKLLSLLRTWLVTVA